MSITMVMCGWCHASCDVRLNLCPFCGHEPGKSRMDCKCVSCQAQAQAFAQWMEGNGQQPIPPAAVPRWKPAVRGDA